MKSYPLCLAMLSLIACVPMAHRPTSVGEQESGYTYVPIDPFPVEVRSGLSCQLTESLTATSLLRSLPDNAVRMLVEKFETGGRVTYGPSNLEARVGSFRVTIDYINADTTNMRVYIGKSVLEDAIIGLPAVKPETSSPSALLDIARGNSGRKFVPLGVKPDFLYVPGSEAYVVLSKKRWSDEPSEVQARLEEVNIPLYVGIGLRVAADIEVFDSKANISGLGSIGAEAEANRLKGSLIVQTLGINGKSIAAALPIQSELNRTTAQNAVVAVGSVKALLYANETVISPRVVGLYLPFPGGKALVNALVSELSKEGAPWLRTCPVVDESTANLNKGK